MTKEKYLNIQEQMGTTPNEEKCPPDMDDFPDSVVAAFLIFNQLGDKVVADIGFIGKDYTNLSLYMKAYQVEETDTIFLEALSRLEAYTIEQSQEQMKKLRNSAKHKK
jgi:hypothetical protein